MSLLHTLYPVADLPKLSKLILHRAIKISRLCFPIQHRMHLTLPLTGDRSGIGIFGMS